MVAGIFLNPNGMTRYSDCIYLVCIQILYFALYFIPLRWYKFLASSQAAPWWVGEDIGCSPWCHWMLDSPDTTEDCLSPAHLPWVLPQVVSVFPRSWYHTLFLRFHRSTQFVWLLTAGLPYHFPSCFAYPPLFRSTLHHVVRWTPWILRFWCWQIFTAHSQIVVVSHKDTTNLGIVKSL